ncbi:saccharopine dehydrogenase NADP-binding domain-containing protein [Budviciaceae bacterium CWB-B4]|uniref:Saccharopine dehydrogenase NADP-binding domain-containing protein n=1 Tax=Limnobaculum xujianqingii TaxID=2738837 RepID=A0A9D7FYE5_9GAMM|nr:saccharopine dehydrogenase NADP-binding domain-containing protein [Limnobaculum xujianqingii]MBK5073368.1 saccharopine dehydrogenase NADP-binding domain-containing protein [Limnobaculum xujianqingii]MBK5176901.1 saccharopine dehydrogenase NADP-binding domain-containing protein [Limnobaculum xujianqingii]
MTKKTIEHVYIAGGYGMIGSHIAMQIRQRFPAARITLAGRNPVGGEKLAQQLGNAASVSLDLNGNQSPEAASNADMIISSVPDPQNMLAEYAIKNHIAFINITLGNGDDILPLLNLAKYCHASQLVVPLGYYEAGMLLPLVALLARQFKRVDTVDMTALHDPSDPLGELSSQELNNDIPPALMRRDGYWIRSSEPREVTLFNHEKVSATPFSILDISAVSAMTNATSVRLDVASGSSVGMHHHQQPSIDLYVDMKGINASGQPVAKRILASDPQGQAHFTALGVLTVIEAMLTSDNVGFILPEEFIDFDIALQSMREAGVSITQS